MNNQKLNLVISERAKQDLIEIADFIAKDNLKTAIAVVDLLRHYCETLTLFPNIGTQNSLIHIEGVRVFIAKWKYVIVYKIVDDDLVILKISNHYQDICNLL